MARQLMFRCVPSHFEQIKAAAEKMGLSLASFCRLAALEKAKAVNPNGVEHDSRD